MASVCLAGEQPALKDQKSKDSYSLGYDFGRNIKGRAVEVDRDVLISAIKDGLDGKPPVMSEEEMRTTLVELRDKVAAVIRRNVEEQALRNLKAGQEFMDANKKKEGVKTLPDGLQYKVLTEGTNPLPKATDTVRVDYRGTLVDGAEFDSSYARGKAVVIPVTGVIKGWT